MEPEMWLTFAFIGGFVSLCFIILFAVTTIDGIVFYYSLQKGK